MDESDLIRRSGLWCGVGLSGVEESALVWRTAPWCGWCGRERPGVEEGALVWRRSPGVEESAMM